MKRKFTIAVMLLLVIATAKSQKGNVKLAETKFIFTKSSCEQYQQSKRTGYRYMDSTTRGEVIVSPKQTRLTINYIRGVDHNWQVVGTAYKIIKYTATQNPHYTSVQFVVEDKAGAQYEGFMVTSGGFSMNMLPVNRKSGTYERTYWYFSN